MDVLLSISTKMSREEIYECARSGTVEDYEEAINTFLNTECIHKSRKKKGCAICEASLEFINNSSMVYAAENNNLSIVKHLAPDTIDLHYAMIGAVCGGHPEILEVLNEHTSFRLSKQEFLFWANLKNTENKFYLESTTMTLA